LTLDGDAPGEEPAQLAGQSQVFELSDRVNRAAWGQRRKGHGFGAENGRHVGRRPTAVGGNPKQAPVSLRPPNGQLAPSMARAGLDQRLPLPFAARVDLLQRFTHVLGAGLQGAVEDHSDGHGAWRAFPEPAGPERHFCLSISKLQAETGSSVVTALADISARVPKDRRRIALSA
jgi:hypothetical protein